MDRRSRYLALFFALIVIVVAVYGYQNFFIERNFLVKSVAECDPALESCFVFCEGECEDSFYKKITKMANQIEVCNPAKEECPALTCGENEIGCKVTYCSEETIEPGEVCTNTSDYQVQSGEELEATDSEFGI